MDIWGPKDTDLSSFDYVRVEEEMIGEASLNTRYGSVFWHSIELVMEWALKGRFCAGYYYHHDNKKSMTYRQVFL